MVWPILFAGFVIVMVALRYLRPWGESCPQCSAARAAEAPLCPECGWIYELPGDEDDHYGDVEEEEEETRI